MLKNERKTTKTNSASIGCNLEDCLAHKLINLRNVTARRKDKKMRVFELTSELKKDQ
jgi:hypothetical protein